MLEIASENSAAATILRRLVSLVTENGGFFHPSVTVVVESNGQMHVESKLDKTDQSVIMALPFTCLPSVRDFEVSVSDDRLVAKATAEGVSKLHEEIIDLQFELYNLTNKFGSHRETFPALPIASAPDLYRYLWLESGLVHQDDLKIIDPASDQEVVSSFFHTRTADFTSQGVKREGMLLPVVELLNHHVSSPSFSSTDGPGLTVNHSKPADSNECFLSYNNHGILAMYLNYGFVDHSADFVRAVPMEIDLPGVGTLTILNSFAKPPAPTHPAIRDLEYYMPKVAQVGSNRLIVGHLIIPPRVARQSLRRILEFLIRSIAKSSSTSAEIAHLVASAEKQVLSGTTAYYRKLSLMVNGSDAKHVRPDVVDALKKISRHQLRVLERYKKQVRSMPLTYIDTPAVES